MADIALPGLMLLVYADPKTGKTTLCLRAFPTAICIGIKSAIEQVAMNTCGISPLWIVENIQDLPSLVGFLEWLKTQPELVKRYRAIYVDDFTNICAISMFRWDDAAPTSVKKGRDQFFKYAQLDRHLDMVSSLLRELGIPAVLSAHETKPDSEKEKRGAPDVPSANQVQSVPGWADLVARMTATPTLTDPFWKGSLFVDPNDQRWITGDRFSVCGQVTPGNLREILRASQGHIELPRYPGLEWQNEWANHVDEQLRAGVPVLDVAERVQAHFGDYAAVDTPGERHVLWAIQDGIARFDLRNQRAGGFLGRARLAAAKVASSAPPPGGAALAPPSTK